MECLGRKRKGVEISTESEADIVKGAQLTALLPHLSLEDYSRREKKCKELVVSCNTIASTRCIGKGVVTAPACWASILESPCRGLKRKIGCIDEATRLGRKKKIEQDYDLGTAIGQGKFGSVVLCRNKVTGEEFACKTLRKGEEIVHREVEIMQHLSGYRGVVTLKAVYEDAESFHLVMELCSGGRLLNQMAKEGTFSEQKAANIIKELMLAIRYCHEMGVVHRDVKPENILLMSSGQMKLADFGLAVRISDGQNLTGISGSPAYVAPDVLLGNYSEKVDIWSAGVLLHALLIGVLPFQGDSLESMFEAIKKEHLDFHSGAWESVSRPARDLLSGMLTRDVATRLNANDVLRHPWIAFYTESSPKTLTPKPKKKHIISPSKRLSPNQRQESARKGLTFDSSTVHEDSCPNLASSSEAVEETEGGDLIDVLASAISRVRISEPKRSRICSPSRTIEPQCSANLKTSNLCTAF